MPIELSFRDLKRQHFGSGLECRASKDAGRFTVLALIASLAALLLWLIGTAAERGGWHARMCPLFSHSSDGLAVFLNTTAVDEQFRRFNGHTQVNATDLKRMHYPSRSMLLALGEWAIQQSEITQEMVDAQLEEIIKSAMVRWMASDTPSLPTSLCRLQQG